MLFEHVSYSLPLLKRSFHHSKERPKQKPPSSEKKWLFNGNMSSFGSSGSAGPFDDDGYNFIDGTDPVKESGSNSSPILKYHVYPSGGADGGPILPMEPEKGFALREWQRENARRLEEKEKKEKEMLGEIIEEAEVYKEEFYRKRQLAVENRKASNREKEKLFLANEEKFHGEAEQNCWKVIGELIPREVAVIEKRGKKKDEEKKKTGIVVIQGPKPGKPTDMSRMRQILLKLKHNPPLHMKPKRPPSEESKRDGKGVAATAAASAATNQSTVAVAGE